MAADPFALATDLLARVVAYFATQAVALPASHYVTAGDSRTIAYDGESVMVNLDFVGEGQPGMERSTTPVQIGFTQRYVQYAVTILRICASMSDDGTPPTATALQADAQANIRDALVLHEALEDIRAKCNAPGGWVGVNMPMTVGRTSPVGPAGTMMAVVGSIQVGLL